MRNAEIIAHVNEKIVAELLAAGATVDLLTLDELAAVVHDISDPNGGDLWRARSYWQAVTPDVQQAISPSGILPQPVNPEAPEKERRYGLTPLDEAFIEGEEYDILDILTAFERYVAASSKPTQSRVALADEQAMLASIPARHRPKLHGRHSGSYAPKRHKP